MPWRPTEPGDFPTLGWLALDWFEAMLAQPEAQEYEPFVCTQEQADFLLAFYRLDPDTGRRLRRRGVISRPRGWGKSPFTAAVAAFEALGPALFEGWDSEGQPVGQPWSELRRPLVEIAAVSEDQVDTNTWAPLMEIIGRGPVVDEYPGTEPMAGFIALPYGRIQKRTAEARSAKGAPAHFVVCDQALALDTPIPSPSGWTTMGALAAGDVIFGSTGPVRVSVAKPVSLDHDCYRVTFADGTSVVASAGHLWQSKVSESAAAPKVRTTEQMIADGRTFRVPVAPAQEMPAADHNLPPYLLGLWLGDGTRGKCEIAVSHDDLAATQRSLAERGVESWVRVYGDAACVNLTFTRARGFGMTGRPAVAKALQSLPCYRDKHIPAEFLAGSTMQRAELVRGLMDSDGSVSKTGSCTFVSTESRLADGITQLLRSLGQVTTGARWHEDARYTGGGKYLVTFTPRGGFQPFAMPRKASRVKADCGRGAGWITITSIIAIPRVPVRCIGVESDDHLFAAGVGGHLTHNTEEWVRGNGGVGLFNTLRNNVIKRGGHLLESPNAYTPGLGSVAESSMAAFQAIREGRARVDDGVLFDHREAPADTVLTDRGSLMAGLAIAYGDSADVQKCAIHEPPCKSPGWVDLEHIASSIWDPDADEQLSRSDWLNQITHASDSWVSHPEWAARAAADTVVGAGEVVTLGFDGSRGRAKGKPDATALIGCRVSDGHLFEVGVWEVPTARPDEWAEWEPPIVEIEAALRGAFATYRVAAFYADPAKDWRSHVNAWEATFGSQVTTKARANHPFEWWMNSGRSGLVQAAVEALEGAIRNGDMTHSGEHNLTSHVLNARRRLAHGKLRLDKSNDYSPNKIDAAAAAVLAWQARLDALAGGALTSPARRSTRVRRVGRR